MPTTLDKYIANRGTTQATGSFSGGTTLDKYLGKTGVKNLDQARQMLAQQDERKKQIELQKAAETAQQALEDFHNKQQETSQGNIFTRTLNNVKGFMGFSPTLPAVQNAPAQYNAIRQGQTLQNEANGPTNWAGRAGNFLADNVVPAIQKGGAGTAQYLMSSAKMTAGIANEQDINRVKDTTVGAVKDISQLASGVAKVGAQFATGGMYRKALGAVGLDKNTPEYIKKTDSFVDNAGILNYKPKYANEAEKTGGEIAELASWFIPISRTAKAEQAMAHVGTAIADIPKVEKLLGTTPRVIKSGGKLFYEVGKDAVDIGTLDYLRGKDWNDIKKDAALGAVGGAVIRTGGSVIKNLAEKSKIGNVTKTLEESFGKLHADEKSNITDLIKSGKSVDEVANQITQKRQYEKDLQGNIKAVTDRFDQISDNEKNVVESLTKQGKTPEQVARAISKAKTFVVSVLDNSDQMIRGIAKSPEDYSKVAKDITGAKEEILKLESASTRADLQKRYDFAKDWKKQFENEFGYKIDKQKINELSSQALKENNGHYQEIYDTATAAEKSLRRKAEKEAGKATKIEFKGNVEQKTPTKEIEGSVLQRINPQTGEKEFQVIKKGELPAFDQHVDHGIAGENIGGWQYHLTAKSPQQMIERGFKDTGIADVTKLPKYKGEAASGEGIAKAASDINKKLVKNGFDELPTEELAHYDKISKADQIEKTAQLIQNDYGKARMISLGKENVPGDMRAQVIFNAVKNKAQQEGDVNLLIELANSPLASERSRLAQELGAAGFNNNPESAVDQIMSIVKTRKEAITKKLGTKKITKETTNITSEIKEKVKKSMPTKDDWNKFLNEITC